MTEFDPARRRLLKAGAAAGAVVATSALAEAKAPAGGDTAAQAQHAAPPSVDVLLQVNGSEHRILVDPRITLLDALRERLRLTGPKKGCDQGQCGACTVIVDGRRILSCLTLAVMQEGRRITTIEGLGTPASLHPMQSAFIRYDGFQCGFCTPGQICSAVAMLEEVKAGIPSHVTADLTVGPKPTDVELRERMSGNICRCGAYSNIQEAIAEAAGVRQ